MKAFNTVFGHMQAQRNPLDVLIAGDNAEAKATVSAFIKSLELRPMDTDGSVNNMATTKTRTKTSTAAPATSARAKARGTDGVERRRRRLVRRGWRRCGAGCVVGYAAPAPAPSPPAPEPAVRAAACGPGAIRRAAAGAARAGARPAAT